MTKSKRPNEKIAESVVSKMTNEVVLSVDKMPTGEQNFVCAVKTDRTEYIIRMTIPDYKSVFIAALYWQEKLMPLGIPFAKFIQYDLTGEYSEFPALLMLRLPGNDICNIYSDLTDIDKKNLSAEMIKIQSTTKSLPLASGFGIASSYEQNFKFQSWYDFVVHNLKRFIFSIEKNKVYDISTAMKALHLAKALEDSLRAIEAKPFLWDASERNVIVHNGKITGIVDVDEICFGDHLLVLGLTSVGLRSEGYDDLYVQYWAKGLQLDKNAQQRLVLYQLFYCLAFMSKHATTSANKSKVVFDINRLKSIFETLLRNMLTL